MGMFDGIISSVGNAISGVALKDIAAPLLGAAGSYLGQNSANNANQQLMQQGNAFNEAQSQKQMDFQKEMRATQYQTSVQDLKAAGLNPMLAYTQGGSGTPSGASASSVSPPKVESALGNAANSAATTAMAMNNVMQKKQKHQKESQTRLEYKQA